MIPYLHGNGKPCEPCDVTGMSLKPIRGKHRRCKSCKGTGIVPRPISEVIGDLQRQARQPTG